MVRTPPLSSSSARLFGIADCGTAFISESSRRGLTIDISSSDTLLEAVSALVPGARLDLIFESTDAVGCWGGGTISRHGRVVRHGTPTPSIPYPAGVQFIVD